MIFLEIYNLALYNKILNVNLEKIIELMEENQKNLESILINGLSHVLRRTIEVNRGDQLAIAQEYREWINCISASDFQNQEILVMDEYTFD